MRKVIYTAIVGGYDDICQPKVIAKDFDYVLFTNDIKSDKVGVWNIYAIPYHNSDNTRVARWVKSHPHVLLADYDYSLWIDSNVIVDDYAFFDIINSFIYKGIEVASMDHIERQCIYEEGYAVIYNNVDKTKVVLQQMLAIKHQNYPYNNGLIETNCLLRNHNNINVKKMCDDWWSLIERYSRRDQLSFNYVLWKNGLTVKLILPKGYNTRNHSIIHCRQHNKINGKEMIIWRDYIRYKFAALCKNHYNKMINNESYSREEYYHYLLVLWFRRYLDIVIYKYKYSTIIKRLFSKK